MNNNENSRRPILLSVPHASSHVPEEIRDVILLSESELQGYVDLYTNEIYSIQGYHLMFGSVCRVFVDVNRAPDDIAKEYSMGEGGVVVYRTQDGKSVYREVLSDELIRVLMKKYHNPYHAEIDSLIPRLQFIFDCHSYLPVGPPMKCDAGMPRPDFNIGNRYFSTCSREHTVFIRDFWQDKGFSVGINKPYAGGYVLAYHCHRRRIPHFLVPGMQIEISQGLYVNQETMALIPEKLQQMNAFVQNMVDAFYEHFFGDE